MIFLMTTAPPANAPWYLGRKHPPLGLAYIGAALEKNGFKTELLDNYLLQKPIDEVKLTIKKAKPDIVGITCGSATYQRCVESAKAVKEVLPSCKVVVGGWHPSYMPESMLQHPEIDYAVIGEGERAMVELAIHITKNKNNSTTVEVPGVAYKHKGQFIKNAPNFISNMDEIPFPARHLLPMNLYERNIEFLDAKPVDVMSITRGCPYQCTFCETKKLWGPTCRAFSPNRVIDEIQHLTSKHGSKGIYFIGDNFTTQRLKFFLNNISQALSIGTAIMHHGNLGETKIIE